VSADGLRILITNITLGSRTGTETFVCDLARGLREAGDRPMVWSPVLGPLADDLRAAGVPVAADLASVPARPDVIHGHHNLTTLAALLRFPSAPAVFVVHDRTSWFDEPPLVRGVARWVAVDRNCLDRLTLAGIPEARTAVIYNWVDPQRFVPRRTLPPRPQRALVFSNYVGRDALAVLQHACGGRGITLDVLGAVAGNATGEPERILPDYDVIFAKGRSALEAMAAGGSVVLFGPTGLGPLVTAREIRRLRPLNFGMRAIATPVTIENVDAELARYDPADAARVTAWIRAHAGPAPAIAAWRALYRKVARRPRSRRRPQASERLVISRFLEGLGAYTWGLVEKSARLAYEVEQRGRPQERREEPAAAEPAVVAEPTVTEPAAVAEPPVSEPAMTGPPDAPGAVPLPPSAPAREWTLRGDPAGPADEEFLRGLYASSRRDELTAAAGSAEQAEALVRMQFAAQQHQYREAYPEAEDRIVLAEGEPIGRFYVNRAPGEILVVDMALLPHARGRGLGSALVKELMDEAAAHGQVVRSLVLLGNTASLRMGLGLGFVVVSEDGPFLRMEWRPPGRTGAGPDAVAPEEGP
jgi:GNAT superfamily N-acetyltransferase